MALVMVLSLAACGTDESVNEVESVVNDFDAEYDEIIEQIQDLNSHASLITGIIYRAWSKVGVSNFSTFYQALLTLQEGTTVVDGVYKYLGAAAIVLQPNKYFDDDIDAANNLVNAMNIMESDEQIAQEVLSASIDFNNALISLPEEDAALSENMKVFKEKYKDEHEDEVDNLREWVLESSMYVDFAVSPSGSLIEYGNSMTEYEESFNRFSKIADSF